MSTADLKLKEWIRFFGKLVQRSFHQLAHLRVIQYFCLSKSHQTDTRDVKTKHNLNLSSPVSSVCFFIMCLSVENKDSHLPWGQPASSGSSSVFSRGNSRESGCLATLQVFARSKPCEEPGKDNFILITNFIQLYHQKQPKDIMCYCSIIVNCSQVLPTDMLPAASGWGNLTKLTDDLHKAQNYDQHGNLELYDIMWNGIIMIIMLITIFIAVTSDPLSSPPLSSLRSLPRWRWRGWLDMLAMIVMMLLLLMIAMTMILFLLASVKISGILDPEQNSITKCICTERFSFRQYVQPLTCRLSWGLGHCWPRPPPGGNCTQNLPEKTWFWIARNWLWDTRKDAPFVFATYIYFLTVFGVHSKMMWKRCCNFLA